MARARLCEGEAAHGVGNTLGINGGQNKILIIIPLARNQGLRIIILSSFYLDMRTNAFSAHILGSKSYSATIRILESSTFMEGRRHKLFNKRLTCIYMENNIPNMIHLEII